MTAEQYQSTFCPTNTSSAALFISMLNIYKYSVEQWQFCIIQFTCYVNDAVCEFILMEKKKKCSPLMNIYH